MFASVFAPAILGPMLSSSRIFVVFISRCTIGVGTALCKNASPRAVPTAIRSLWVKLRGSLARGELVVG
jgi:hypothetical protein